MGFFDISVSCFVNCHIIKFGCCCGPLLAKNYLLNDHTLEQIFLITHNKLNIIIQGHSGIQGGRISLLISYISLAIYTHIHLNTFHILSINNANKCGGRCGHTFSYLARRFTLYISYSILLFVAQFRLISCSLLLKFRLISCSLLLNSDLFHALSCFMLSMMLGNYLNIKHV